MRMTLDQLEAALAKGQLQVTNGKGKWYTVRRNGRTQTWKREPDRYSIPVKVGFRECFRIEPGDGQEYRVGTERT